MQKKKVILFSIAGVVVFFSLISAFVNNDKFKNSSNINDNTKTNIINSVNDSGVDKDMDFKSILSGKTIAMIGDSLIDGYGTESGGLDVHLAKKMPGATYINNSVSGSTVTDNTGNDTIVMINQARNLGGNPDIILFDGGVNDVIAYDMKFISTDLEKPIGKINMEDSNPSSEDTVMADFEEVVQVLKNKFPNTKLCYVQLCLLDDTSINMLAKQVELKDGIKQRRDEFLEQIKLMCQKWDVGYLDISSKFIGTGIQYRQEDWLHINDEGYKLISPYILSYMAEEISK